QRLQGRGRQAPRTQRERRAIDRLGVLPAREELPAARDLRQAHAMAVAVEFGANLLEGRTHRRLARLGVEGRELFDRQRPGRREERGLKQLREGTHVGSPWVRREKAARA